MEFKEPLASPGFPFPEYVLSNSNQTYLSSDYKTTEIKTYSDFTSGWFAIT